MTTYNFSLIFRLPPEAPDTDDLIEALAAAGCDDAIVGTGHPGRVALDFDREADDAAQALRTAVSEVQSHLYVALDNESIDELTFQNLQARSETVGRKISTFIAHLKRTTE